MLTKSARGVHLSNPIYFEASGTAQSPHVQDYFNAHLSTVTDLISLVLVKGKSSVKCPCTELEEENMFNRCQMRLQAAVREMRFAVG